MFFSFAYFTISILEIIFCIYVCYFRGKLFLIIPLLCGLIIGSFIALAIYLILGGSKKYPIEIRHNSILMISTVSIITYPLLTMAVFNITYNSHMTIFNIIMAAISFSLTILSNYFIIKK